MPPSAPHDRDARAIPSHALPAVVADVLAHTPFIDIHTHLYAPAFGALGLWGIDDLVTYHYLEAELFRSSSTRPETYWALDKRGRADRIWRTLFVERPPISEATRGVVAVLAAFGLDTEASSLADARAFFAAQSIDTHLPRVFDLAGISDAVMTNDPLDPDEWPRWQQGVPITPQLHAALRIDRVLNDYAAHASAIAAQGYPATPALDDADVTAVRRFLADWVVRMKPRYMAVSLPNDFSFPKDDLRTRMLERVVLPTCREFDLPLALMIGVRRQVNPALRLAGDASGLSDLASLGRLCAAWPENRFLVTVLSRENQHELCVYARKFSNLLPFGCWWFLNNSSIVAEMTRMRLEMLGTTFIPQHSDARILEQVIYKWRNTRRTVAIVLADGYRALADDGRPVRRADIEQDVTRLFRENFDQFAPIRS